jgi:hypothetical protein
VVVGSALPRVLFDVTDNAETQLRIFVEDLSNGTQIRGDNASSLQTSPSNARTRLRPSNPESAARMR